MHYLASLFGSACLQGTEMYVKLPLVIRGVQLLAGRSGRVLMTF